MTTRPGDRQPPRPRVVSSAEPRGDSVGKTLKSDNLRLPDPDAALLPKSARNVLSAEEIDALLNPDLSDLAVPSAARAETAPSEPSVFERADDAKRKALTLACDTFVARLSHRFQGSGEIGALLRLGAAETRPFRASIDSHAGEAVFVCFSDEAGRVGAALVLPPEAASALVERAGGASEGLSLSARPRALTALDEALLARGLSPLMDVFPALSGARIYDHRLKAGATVPLGDAVRLSLTLQIGTRGWPTTLMLDTGLIERPDAGDGQPGQALAGQSVEARGGSDLASTEQAPRSGASALTAVVTARIASLSVPLSRLSSLKPGATLDLGIPADSPVSLVTGEGGGQVVAQGALGREGERVAIRLSRKSRAFS